MDKAILIAWAAMVISLASLALNIACACVLARAVYRLRPIIGAGAAMFGGSVQAAASKKWEPSSR